MDELLATDIDRFKVEHLVDNMRSLRPDMAPRCIAVFQIDLRSQRIFHIYISISLSVKPISITAS